MPDDTAPRTRARPRLWETAANVGADAKEIAFHLGISVEFFRQKLRDLEARGFPKPHAITGKYSVPAVDHWWAREHNLTDDAPTDNGTKWDTWRPRTSK